LTVFQKLGRDVDNESSLLRTNWLYWFLRSFM